MVLGGVGFGGWLVGWNAGVPRDEDVLVRGDGRHLGKGVEGGGEVFVVVLGLM